MFKKLIMKRNYLTKIILTLSLSAIGLSVIADTKKEEKSKKQYPRSYYMKQFQDAFDVIERKYVQEPDRQEMIDEAINGMLLSLDRYSNYCTDEELEFFLDNSDGEFGGIGVQVMYDTKALAIKVISPIDDLPAYKAGIKSGDYILGVNGQLVSDLGFNKAIREMRGKKGTKLSLLISREEENKTEEIELTRTIVELNPVKYELEEEYFGGIAYVRVSSFNSKTSNRLKDVVKNIEKDLKKKNKELKGIVLDLRNNPGGLLEQAVGVSEFFLNHGVVVTTKGRKDKKPMTLSASRFTKKSPQVPMVVLINSGTASAAEIVSGALQDHKRAIIMGTTSFGKGLVQTVIPMSDRSAIKLTTAKYYTPNGRDINAKGIEPDIYIESANVKFKEKDKDEKEKTFNTQSIKGYLKKYNNEKNKTDKAEEDKKDTVKKDNKKNNKHIMSKKYKEDYQYARAYDLIRGLILSNSKQIEE